MRVLTFSRHFPAKHPKEGQPTMFVEKIWNSLNVEAFNETFWWPGEEYTEEYDFNKQLPCGTVSKFLSSLTNRYDIGEKVHTIRSGSRWQVGDMISLRVWSDKPYRSKQIEFAQVEVKKVWDFELRPMRLNGEILIMGFINGELVTNEQAIELANNDGLNIIDFDKWLCPDGTKFIVNLPVFTGQIICWSSKPNYSPSTISNEQ